MKFPSGVSTNDYFRTIIEIKPICSLYIHCSQFLMKSFKIELRKITGSEYQTIRNTTDWPVFELDIIDKALEKDLFSVCVLDKKKIVGIGRVIGDGAIYFYIQDVIVIPEYQKKGIGKLIMNCIEKFLHQNAKKGSFIGLMAAKGVKDFYVKYSFQERSSDKPGMYKIIDK